LLCPPKVICMNLQAGSLAAWEQSKENQQSGLESIEKECWALLQEGSSRGKSAFHTFVLGTRRLASIELRTLVLRKIEKSSRSLFTHTDLRSPKTDQLRQNESCSLLFYDPVRRVQLRLEAEPFLHEDNEICDLIWSRTNMSARKSYLSSRPPGTPLSQPEDGLPRHLNGCDPRPEESEDGRRNFLVLEFRVKSMDWLFLNAQGHRRAKFHYGKEGLEACWINP